jgi:DNA repair exonuclease SbcCD nuclease subunit
MPLRVLFLSDTHLGLDLPSRPRVERPRRGDDLFESFERALEPATRGEVHVLIHGGDLFFRSRVPAWLACRVFARLAELADQGLDVFWVPGNHERSGVPRALLLTHPGIRVFDRPRTYLVRHDGVALGLSGFPYAPRVRDDFPSLLAATGHADVEADVRLLCLHQAVEGATVGPVGYAFRSGEDVLRVRDVPSGFAAVLSGHIHRAQVLTRDLARRPLAAPILFAGSTDRTSFAERFEPKGTFLLEAAANGAPGGAVTWEFRELAVRLMTVLELDPAREGVEARLGEALAGLDPRSLVRVRLLSEPPPEALPLFRAETLRAAAPPGMSLSVAWPTSRSAFTPRRASTLHTPPARQPKEGKTRA